MLDRGSDPPLSCPRRASGLDRRGDVRDAALSGFGVEHRPGYQQLLAGALASPPHFDVILVEDLSRLTRDMAELMRLTARLHLKGIELIGVSDGIATGRQGAKVHLAVKGLMNELYLDDLRDKTHRGLTGSVSRHLSPGGRIYGYRTVPVPTEARPGAKRVPARYEIEAAEAEVVRRIFRDYASGRSLKAIAHALNAEGVLFPAKDTKRGPVRRGWAVSTIGVILGNEKYAGTWIWNKTRFLKDPETGRRRPVRRPEVEWVRQARPDLRIVEPTLWTAVQSRHELLRETGTALAHRRPRGGDRVVYSSYLLSGLVRCGWCGARMIAQRTTRRKGGRVYPYGYYRCSFAAHKGPAVCGHGTWYRQEPLEHLLLERFRAATSAPMLDALTAAVARRLEAAVQARDARAEALKGEILHLERDAGNLVRFLRGGQSGTVREELATIESALQGLRVELSALQGADRPAPPSVSRTWIEARVEQLATLIAEDPARARVEIRKHFEGDIELVPPPSERPDRRVELRGRLKHASLLTPTDQEAGSPTIGWRGWI
jgi:site-specific DNA recombinase